MMSMRREVIGRKVAKSTYILFMMADEVAFVRWLGREGCLKFGWRDATWAGSQKSAGEEREPRLEEEVRPEGMAVFGKRLPAGGL